MRWRAAIFRAAEIPEPRRSASEQGEGRRVRWISTSVDAETRTELDSLSARDGRPTRARPPEVTYEARSDLDRMPRARRNGVAPAEKLQSPCDPKPRPRRCSSPQSSKSQPFGMVRTRAVGYALHLRADRRLQPRSSPPARHERPAIVCSLRPWPGRAGSAPVRIRGSSSRAGPRDQCAPVARHHRADEVQGLGGRMPARRLPSPCDWMASEPRSGSGHVLVRTSSRSGSWPSSRRLGPLRPRDHRRGGAPGPMIAGAVTRAAGGLVRVDPARAIRGEDRCRARAAARHPGRPGSPLPPVRKKKETSRTFMKRRRTDALSP